VGALAGPAAAAGGPELARAGAGGPNVTPVERLGHAVVLFAAQVGAMAARAPGGAAGRPASPLEALVHVTVWHETYAVTVRTLLDGRRPILPRGEYAEINAAALARERACPPGRLVARLLRAQAALEALAPRADAADLRFAFKAGATVRPWSAALAVAERHVRSHLEEVTCAPATVRAGAARRRPHRSGARPAPGARVRAVGDRTARLG